MALRIHFFQFSFLLSLLIATYAEAKSSTEPSPTRRPGTRTPGEVETIPIPGIDLSQPPKPFERIPPPPLPPVTSTQRYRPIPPSQIPAVKDHVTAAPTVFSTREAPADPVGPPQSEVDRKRELVSLLAERVADLLSCVPSNKENDYSTQSWYLVDTYIAWNNLVVEGQIDEKDLGDVKALFEAKALEQFKLRNPELANDPNALSYFKNAAQSAEAILSSKNKEKVQDFSKGVALLKTTSRVSGKNIFEGLKAAHTSNATVLQKNVCTGLDRDFFSTPTFKTGTSKIPSAVVHKISERPAALSKILDEEKKRAAFNSDIDKKYPRSNTISTQLPQVKPGDGKAAGYYSAGRYQWGRAHVIGNILKAADVLKKEGITMGVADINQRGGDEAVEVDTPGYRNRDEGRKATFMALNSSGNPVNCSLDDRTCYDQDKTFQMMTALIDADPDNIKTLEVNDSKLRARLSDYLVKYHNYKRISANWIIRRNHEFKNAVNIEWRE